MSIVQNSNSHIPVFSQSQYTATVGELATSGTVCIGSYARYTKYCTCYVLYVLACECVHCSAAYMVKNLMVFICSMTTVSCLKCHSHKALPVVKEW